MNILVTGADGFLGAVAVEALLASGQTVGALVQPAVPIRRVNVAADGLHLLRADLEDGAALSSLLDLFRPDACLHLAWYAEPGQYLHSPRNLALLQDSLNLIQLLAECGCGHFVGVGTCAEYDSGRGWLREDGPTRPETLYAASKLALYLCGEHLARAGGMAFAWTRVFYPYGPGEDARRMVPALITALLDGQPFPASQGDQVRDYIHVEDIAQAFVILLAQKAEGIFNIGSGEPIQVRRLMETIEEIVGSTGLIQFGALPPRDWEPPFLCADAQKLYALGWQMRYDLRSGLAATVDWWREQKSARPSAQNSAQAREEITA